MLEYEILVEGAEPLRGSVESRGEVRVHPQLRPGRIEAVRGRLKLEVGEKEKIFMNGFQTWTHCPEYTKKSRIRGLDHLPRPLVKHYGLDRYGDYFFVNYPNKSGVTHGESYCYFRDGLHFRLIASLDETAGYTLFTYDAAKGELSLERDCAGVVNSGSYPAFDLFFAEGDEDEVFDAWFAAMGIKPRTTGKLAGYSSWYNRYQNINEASIESDLEGCQALLRPGDLFQIDDGWEPAVGDWLAADGKKFPSGMKSAAERIHQKGFRAGLWLAPFVCQKSSAIYREHPDWLLRHDGQSWYCGCNWGGFWALDIDKPAVRDYLGQVFDRVFNEWGYDLVKLDFLYAAAPFGDEKESRAGRMTRAMKLLRQLCGDKLILGCGVPVMPAFGIVDYCRVSCDVGLDWNSNIVMRQINRERVSTKQAIENSIFRRQLNGRAYLSDPDVFFLREDNLHLSEEQKYKLATVNSLFGGVLLCSDNMSSYSPAARELYARLLKNRHAEDIIVEAESGLSVSYELDGVSYTLEIE